MEQAIQQTGIRKGLTKLVIPIFIETLLIMMLGAVDTVMLSQYSDESVAAVGVVNQIVMFAFLIFEVINIGTSVLCSQYLGAGMRNKMVQVVGVSLLLNLALRVEDFFLEGESFEDAVGFSFREAFLDHGGFHGVLDLG